ncbi:MAG: D-alanine--D-alanine ligase [Actinomycetota bacterium]|nr:D-alanine--D-alanine ligase [Actinomycetota bacterium]
MDGQRTKLVVLFGGRSAEHEVSCVSAVSVLAAIDPSQYEVVPVGVTHDGQWLLADEAARLLTQEGPAALPPALEATGSAVSPDGVLSEPGTVVFPLLHGPFGEDGTVQGLCELAGVPYVGSGVLGSAAAMDKVTTKRLLCQAGIPVPRYLGLREWDIDDRLAGRVGDDLGWPVFVKPSNLGSSIGVSKADDPDALLRAIEVALAYDEWIVVEEAVTGREIECGVLGDRDPQASVPGEVRPSREFYDYEDKYEEGKAELVIPADLSPSTTAEVRRLAVDTFRAVRAEGMARVDFFLSEADEVLVNEVNTIPGFTPISMYPRMWEASGLSYAALVDRLVTLAVERHARRSGRVGRGRV